MARLRIAVTGRHGQVVRSLIERAAGTDIVIIPIGRPALDLADPEAIESALASPSADVLVSAAAYTDVNKAEAESELADRINGRAAGLLAVRAKALGIPVIQLSTDYVFDGTKAEPYTESDPVCPVNAYGRSKAAGERAVAAMCLEHVILRTSWVYSSVGRNFVRTMLDLARKQDTVRVVGDQVGNPTAASDIADGVLAVARNLVAGRGDERYGTFHMAAAGSASWADFAAAIFAASAECGGPSARVVPIASAEYQTPARRPANSRLDCAKIARVHGVVLPSWQPSLAACVGRILEQAA
ncbi:MAG: dTDP-4-dehydrorhamnose reductase [Xanthobacteraceae bacterium]|nr:dTDP-4-dehydrorhamnose reductase [Xanthobacteraceae bacterium]